MSILYMDISEPGRFNKKTTSTQSNAINQESPWLSARATQNVSEYQKAKPRRGTAPMTTRRLNLIHVTSFPDFKFSFWGDEYCWTPLLVGIKLNQLGWFNAWPWDEMSHGSWCSWRRVLVSKALGSRHVLPREGGVQWQHMPSGVIRRHLSE